MSEGQEVVEDVKIQEGTKPEPNDILVNINNLC